MSYGAQNLEYELRTWQLSTHEPVLANTVCAPIGVAVHGGWPGLAEVSYYLAQFSWACLCSL